MDSDIDSLVIVVSDLHVISTFGLCTPSVNLDDGGTYFYNKEQKELWKSWLDFWGIVKDYKNNYKPIHTYIVWNGDLVDNYHHDTFQIITPNPTTMMNVCLDVMKPGLDLSDRNFVIRGTQAHSGLSSNIEEKIARDIEAVNYSDGVYSWWKLQAEFGGVLFDFAHTGRVGRRSWTKFGPATSELAEYIISNNSRNIKLVDLLVRSHTHSYLDTGDNYMVRLINTPCWQLKTSYSYQVCLGSFPDIGGCVFLCNKGEYEVDTISYKSVRNKEPIWKEK